VLYLAFSMRLRTETTGAKAAAGSRAA